MKINSRFFTYVFFIPICYMFVGTIALYVGYSYSIFSPLEQRANLLVALSAFGLAYVFIRNNLMFQLHEFIIAAIVLTLYMALRGLQIGSNMISWFISVALWCLVIFITSNVDFNEQDREIVYTICSIAGILMSVFYITGNINTLFISSVEGTNSIYYVLCALPWPVMAKNKWIKFLGVFSITLAVIVSTKGSCLLALVMIFGYFAINFSQLVKKHKGKITLALVVVIISLFFVNQWLGQNMNSLNLFTALQDMFSEASTGGNGRTEIYQMIFDEMGKSSVFPIIFGHGYNAVAEHIHIGSHNDFLMMLFEYGIVGLCLYIYFWVKLITHSAVFPKGSTSRIAYVSSLIIYFNVSMFSNVMNTQIQFLLLCTFWGIMNSQKFLQETTEVMEAHESL